jgi:hypothetical protein
MADHLVPNQITVFFEFQGERERGRDAPLAAYVIFTTLVRTN